MAQVDDKEEIGIGGFTALARVREQVTKTANAPATPLEDGSFAHDHIINNPIQLNIEGRVSDILIKPDAETTVFRRNLAEIGNITKYFPPMTQAQINKIAALVITFDSYRKKIEAVIRDGRQAYEFFGSKDTGGGNHRDRFIEMLDGYYNSKALMRIETGGKVYENMVITSRVTTKDNRAEDSIDYKIIAQELRFADVIYTDIQKYFPAPAPGSVGDQVGNRESKGLNDAPEAETSLLSGLAGVFQ